MNGLIKKKLINNILSYFTITIGTILAALAIDLFLIPNNMIDGGITGISIMLNRITNIKIGIFIILINIPFVLVGYKELGKKFLFKAMYGMTLYSLALAYFENLNSLTNDALLSVFYGGALLGLGVGIVIKGGGCLDGTEAMGILINKKSSLSVGQVVLIFNVFIYSISSLLYGWDRALYSLLTYCISYKVIDLVSEGLEKTKAALIITDEGEKIAENIYKKLGRTVTYINGNGLISGKDKVILYAVITRLEISELKQIVEDDDCSAFVTITDVSEIIGNHIKKMHEVKNKSQKISK